MEESITDSVSAYRRGVYQMARDLVVASYASDEVVSSESALAISFSFHEMALKAIWGVEADAEEERDEDQNGSGV